MRSFPVSRRVTASSVSALLLATAAGCGGGVSQSSYDKVTTGMTQAQVEAILGTGKEQTSSSMATPPMAVGGMSVPGMSTKTLTWQDGSKSITVVFKDDKVFTKAESGL